MPRKGLAELAVVILAAGLGTRMKSSTPKVLHNLLGRPMLSYCLDAVRGLRPRKVVVVVGKNGDSVREAVGTASRTEFAVQKKPKGTAHALISALPCLKGFSGTVLVTNGDTPLVTPETLRGFLRLHRKDGSALSLLSFPAADPTSYGRIVRDDTGSPLRIVEEKDATSLEKAIKEVNSGIYAFGPAALPLLGHIKVNLKKGEYYLTDILEIANGKGLKTGVYCLGREREFMGINTRQDLALASAVLRRNKLRELMEKGVSILDPGSTFVEPSVIVEAETVIYPNVYIQGSTRIGKGCTIYPNVRIIDSTVSDEAVIKDSSLIEHSSIGKGAQVGPFAHLRPQSRIGEMSKIGNFVEVKKSTVGKGTKAMHLSYLGDATIGKNANIGAGTITCNYDGAKKHRTVIGDGVFLGSDSQLVAPVRVGKGSYIGAGSTITKNVPPESLALSRSPQKNVKGWTKRKKK